MVAESVARRRAVANNRSAGRLRTAFRVDAPLAGAARARRYEIADKTN